MKSVIQGHFHAVFCGLLMGAASLLAAERGLCQSTSEPAVVISIANIDEQLNDIEYLATAASEEMGQMSGLIKMQAQGFTRGVDTKKPSGVLMYFSDESPEPTAVAFVPVQNLDDLLDTISGFAEVDEGDDIVTIIADNGQEISLKKVGNYAFVSDQPENLQNVPKDPAKLVGEMAGQYNVAATIFPQRIPESLREQALGLIQLGMDQNLDMLDELEPMQAELQQKSMEMQMEQMENLFNDTEELVIGMAADEKARAVYFDAIITSKPGSQMANQLAESKKAGRSKFSGFLMDGAAMTVNMTTQITPDITEQYKSMLKTAHDQLGEIINADENMDDAQVDMVNKLMDNMFDMIGETVERGRMDMGAMLMTADGKMNFVMGAEVAEPEKLEDSLKEVAKMVEKEVGDEVQFDLNAGSHRGTTFHEILIEVPSSEEEARNILGDQVTLVVGIGKEAVYFGMGDDPESAMKQAMDKSAETSASNEDTSMQFNLFLSPILKFASGIQGAEMLEMMSDTLEAGGDRIQVRSDYIENGVKTRFEIQDGVLQLIGAAGGLMGGLGGGGADF